MLPFQVTGGAFLIPAAASVATGAAATGVGLKMTANFSKIKNIDHSIGKKNEVYKKSKSHLSGKEKANDIPSWAKGNRPYKGESGKDFAKRLCDEKYGPRNYKKGTFTEFNQIKKWGDRAFQ